MNTIRMSALCVLVSLATLFTACEVLGPEPEPAPVAAETPDEKVVAPDGKVVMSVRVETRGRTVAPAVGLGHVDSWELLGTKQGGSQTSLLTFSTPGGDTAVAIEPGVWSFTLTGKKDGALILSGSLANQTISLEEPNVLAFTVAPVLSGQGTIAITINLPDNSAGITAAKVFKEGAEYTTITPAGDKVVFEETHEAGVYFFSIRLFNQAGDLYGVVSEIVYVYASLRSEAAYTLTEDDLNLTYLITYHDAEEGQTLTGHYRMGTAVTLDAPSRGGYYFRGWYADAAFTTGKVTTIPLGSKGDREFYAKWMPQNLSSPLVGALAKIRENAEAGDSYTVTLNDNESLAPAALSYNNKTVTIALTGAGAMRTVSLSEPGTLFTLGSGARLRLGNNITLQGRSDNTASLVQVNSGASLTMIGYSSVAITGNSTSGSGGGVYINGGSFTMEGGSINTNTAANDGGGVYIASGSFTTYGGGINSNTSTNGGGVYVAGGSFNKQSGQLNNNRAIEGGGIYIAGGNLSMGGSLIGNTATNNGGGVYVAGGTSSMNGAATSNTATNGSGGGVYVNGGTFTMNSGSINTNTATSGTGGGVCVASGSFTMKAGTISGNTVGIEGGGICVAGGTFTMSGGDILNNTATSGDGGGAHVLSGTLTMTNGTISGNIATNGSGGGVFVGATGTFTKQGGTIYGSNATDSALRNTAGSTNGHAVYVAADKKRDSTAGAGVVLDSAQNGLGWVETLSESLDWLIDNAEAGGAYTIIVSGAESLTPAMLSYDNKTVSITLEGADTEQTVSLSTQGSLFTVGNGVTLTLGNNITLQGLSDNTASLVQVNSGGTLKLNDSAKISGNEAASNSGGVYILSGGLFTMDGGTISDNEAISDGGGVLVDGGTFTMSGGDISGNTGSEGGGVRVLSGGLFTLSDGTISGNTSGGNGGGVLVDDGTFTMTGGDISDNESANEGGGVRVLSGGLFTMSGGTISGNTALYGGGAYVSGTFTKQQGGVIYGSDADDTLKNTASYGDPYGHAVYESSGLKKRNSTAGVGVTMDSTQSGSEGGWE
jgi:uncharacterized repeat protein (TIGR02543 family)